MIRTSRKWKNAVRFQAKKAFPSEWKCREGLLATGAFTKVQAADDIIPSATDLTGTIPLGSGNDMRTGSQIRVRRVDLWVSIDPPAANATYPDAHVRIELVQHFSNSDPIDADWRTICRYGSTVSAADTVTKWSWARNETPYRVEHNRAPSFRSIIKRVVRVVGIGSFQGWNASVRSNLDRQSGVILPKEERQQNTSTSAVPVVVETELPSGQNTTVPAHNITNTGYEAANGYQTNQLQRGKHHKFFHASHSWSNGLLVTFSDGTSSVPLIGQNTLILFMGTDEQGVLGTVQYRIWYTDE